jgi:LysR family transcriptional regulator, glycine cleavage system transcriptional activator
VPRRRLPPLNAVRAFEAAARHDTFAAAGDELGVTPGAVAQHVKALEAWLGLSLFRRLPSRGVALTAAGERYAATIRDLLDGLADATARLRRGARENVLTVSTAPSFAAIWLIPRLGDLRRARPDLEIRVDASPGLTDFARDEVDVAVRMSRGTSFPGLRADRLFAEGFAPVCAPSLRDGPHPLRRPEDLADHVLLHEEDQPGIPNLTGWRQWLTAAGATGVDPDRGPRCSHTFMTLQMAVAGQGVALVPEVLAADALAAGQLVKPFDLVVPGAYAYFVVAPEAMADAPHVALFRDWILAAFA